MDSSKAGVLTFLEISRRHGKRATIVLASAANIRDIEGVTLQCGGAKRAGMADSAPLRLSLDGAALVGNWRWLAARCGAAA